MSEKPCNFSNRPMSFAAREVGCPLDHCMCGTHDVDNERHVCPDEDIDSRRED
jgi:hypothetical protein